MKKLLYTFLLFSIIFSACEKEEELNNNSNVNITDSNIAGIWKATSLILDSDELVIQGFTTCYFHIRSDMTFSQYFDAFDGSYEYQDGTWELSGSDLKINFVTGEFVHYYINSFTSNTASLNLVEYLDDGIPKYTTGSCSLVKQ